MKQVRFVDTTFRDGHASLWAEAMTTSMMMAVAPQMDRAGFAAMDFMATSHFLKCVKELREDPWERIRLVSEVITETPLSLMMLHSVSTFDLTPDSVLKLWIERVAESGIERLQFMDPANDMTFRIPRCVAFAKEVGIGTAQSIVFSESPKHTDEYYAQKVRDAAALEVDVIYLKDSGGLLTPERVRTLVPLFLENAGGIPVELHSHCTTGLAPLCYLEAARLGIDTFHTAIPPLANGPSQPSLTNIAGNLRFMGYDVPLDRGAVDEVSGRLVYIAKREGLPIGVPLEYDVSQYSHQTPGGVISNLKHQLARIGLQGRLDPVLEEVIQVREDFGYPIMVTPFSQFLITQATTNVVTGERYGQVIDELIKYALGFWGDEAKLSIHPNVRDKILSSARAKELSSWSVPQPNLREVRDQLDGHGLSDEDLLLRYIVRDEEAIREARSKGTPEPYPIASASVVAFVGEILKRRDLAAIDLQKGDFTLSLRTFDRP